MSKVKRRGASNYAPFLHISKCNKCELREDARQVVVGNGFLSAEAMLIGESPGETEDRIGLPFVGLSGEFLFERMRLAGLDRSTFYITNVVKCRPLNNADPTASQVAVCSSHLNLQLKVVNPRVIVPVGRFALNFFFKSLGITAAHGLRYDWKQFSVIPLLHPAHILRNRTEEMVALFDRGVSRIAAELQGGARSSATAFGARELK